MTSAGILSRMLLTDSKMLRRPIRGSQEREDWRLRAVPCFLDDDAGTLDDAAIPSYPVPVAPAGVNGTQRHS
jgi:hypothetical protein